VAVSLKKKKKDESRVTTVAQQASLAVQRFEEIAKLFPDKVVNSDQENRVKLFDGRKEGK
jgi:hypothetical protein